MKSVLYAALFSLLIVACKKTEVVDENAAKTVMNVPYGTDTAQRMDVYLPANRTTASTKILFMIHGGAWTTGDKTDFNAYIPVFQQRLPDYVLVNINYRLAALPSTNVFPTQETDVKAALNFILTKADEYRFNKNKLAVLGASAGGQLAMLQAYKNTSPKVNALVDMFGPTDMAALYAASNTITQIGMQSLLSGTPATNSAAYQSASPINFVAATNPPTLILHGGLDPLVPIAQSTALKNKLQTTAVPVQMVTYPTEGHGWTGSSLADTYDKIQAFLTTYNPN